MDRTSISFTEWLQTRKDAHGKQPTLGAVVVGSGYGGSVAALHLATMGYNVTVLERGSEFLPADFPNDLSHLPKFVRAPSADGKNVSGRANGLFEFRAGPGVVSMVGNGLGGGSLINAGVAIRPDADVFSQQAWPTAIRLPAGAAKRPDCGVPGMDQWFERAEDALNLKKARWPRAHNKTNCFDGLARKVLFPGGGAQDVIATSTYATIDPDTCVDCGDCVTGCNYGAKQTLLDTHLKKASKLGATLVRGVTVWTAEPVPTAKTSGDGHDAVDTWRLRVLDTESASRWPSWEAASAAEGENIDAELIVLAAGTFGSTEILQRSKHRSGEQWWISPELGNRFSGNGDSLNFIVTESESVDAIGVGATSPSRTPEGKYQVGPTITREINLRHATDGKPIPLRNRLTVQDAAVPGAIARVFTELLATGLTTSRLEHWRSGPSHNWWKRFYKERDAGRDGFDPLAASEELARRSHIILTMGHDESRGRIVWAPGRDASVPFWDKPEELETYHIQDELLKRAAASIGAECVPNPAWRLLPESASQTMNGPTPTSSITTVHPLGGCVMGDDPRHSVVDDTGRLWRSDRPSGDKTDTDWQRHQNFFVLDGSIIPTSLGINPLLTITALAERAMHALRNRTPVRRESPIPCDAPNDETCAPQWQLPAKRTWEVTMKERLVAKALPLRGALKNAFGSGVSPDGELDLELKVKDWLGMWESARHPIDEVTGTLRLQVGSDRDSAQVATYRVSAFERCELLAVSEYGPCGLRRYARGFWKILPWLRTGVTYIFLRWDVIYSVCHPKPGQSETFLEFFSHRVLPIFRQIGHSTERRRMHYELTLQLDRGDKVDEHYKDKARDEYEAIDFDQYWTKVWHDKLSGRDKLPESITLIGTKRVEYAASWRELSRFAYHNICRLLGIGRGSDQPLPPLRDSFFDQASHLNVKVYSRRNWKQPFNNPIPGTHLLKGLFLMDFSALLRDPALKLGPMGDLTGGVAALGAYPGLLMRFLVKTRLPDFRLPEYSQVPLPDAAVPEQLRLNPADSKAPPVQRYVLRVPRGESSSDTVDVNHNAEFELILWRYARPADSGDNGNYTDGLPQVTPGTWYDKPVERLKSALLIHAYAQSGYTFTANTLSENLAGKLYNEGYEVWVLEHRLSTRLPIHEEPVTLDQIAEHDLPKAVNFVLDMLKKEFHERRPELPLTHPQLHVFAQCLGSAALAMSLLSGQLHYNEVTVDDDDPIAPRCPKLASIMFSQTHMLCVGQPGTQARTWIPSFIRDIIGRTNIPLGVRGPVDSLAEAWMDRVFAALPIPAGERCPTSLGTNEDDCATCRRVRFIEAPLFKHCNLSEQTHRELPLHFGQANIRTFAQAAKCVEAERLVDEDGQYIYVTDANVRKFGALPVSFLHGEENELFHPESATQTARFFARLHPDWANVSVTALGRDPENDKDKHAAWLVPGHGHYDILIGEKAPTLVYPGIAEFFNYVQSQPSQGVLQNSATDLQAAMHVPRVGPIIGPLRYNAKRSAVHFRVSFMIDDRFTDGKQGCTASRGTRTWAFVRTRTCSNRPYAIQRLEVIQRPASARRLASKSPYRDSDCKATSYRFATGRIELAVANIDSEDSLEIQAFSIHECLAQAPGTYSVNLHPDLRDNSELVQVTPATTQTPEGFEAWLAKLHEKTLEHMRSMAGHRLPLRSTASHISLEAERWHFLYARVSAAALAAAIPSEPGEASSTVRFLAGSCRYPGFPFDRHRAEHSVQRVLQKMQPEDPERHTAFGLFVGDQIYADATAGLVDPLSPTERYAERHRNALKRSTDQWNPALGELLANLPVVMTPDDHEYNDNYPAGSPLVPARTAERVSEVQGVAKAAAHDAWRFFQSSSGGVGKKGWASFDSGPLRVLVLDTRSNRQLPQCTTFSDHQRHKISTWLDHEDAAKSLNLIATGSVVLPGLKSDADPANPGASDTFQWSPLDSEWLLTTLAKACMKNPQHFRFALLSGDYHVSMMSQLKLDDRVVGVSIVVPPVYAPIPYVNATAQSVWFSESIPVTLASGNTSVWTIESLSPKSKNAETSTPVLTGSAIAEITVTRTTNTPALPYKIEWQADLLNYEQGSPIDTVKICTRI